MRFLLVLVLMVVLFVFGVVAGPYVESKGLASQVQSARDTLGLCGGATMCPAGDMAPVDAGPEAAPDAMAPTEPEAPAQPPPP